jgi:hypothetical protein
MSITASCPKCGNGLKAPEHAVGRRIKCLQCQTLFTLTASSPTEAVTDAPPESSPTAAAAPTVQQPASVAVRAAFWLGLLSLGLGVAAGTTGLFAATVGHSRLLAWLGIVLGAWAIGLAIVREECGFKFPFAGSVASVASLALVALWLGVAPAREGPGMGGPFPGGPGGMSGRPPGQGGPPPNFQGGQPGGRRGGPRGDRNQGAPPPPDPPQ